MLQGYETESGEHAIISLIILVVFFSLFLHSSQTCHNPRHTSIHTQRKLRQRFVGPKSVASPILAWAGGGVEVGWPQRYVTGEIVLRFRAGWRLQRWGWSSLIDRAGCAGTLSRSHVLVNAWSLRWCEYSAALGITS